MRNRQLLLVLITLLLVKTVFARNVFVTPAANGQTYVFTADPFQQLSVLNSNSAPFKVLSNHAGTRYYLINRTAAGGLQVIDGGLQNVVRTVNFDTPPEAALVTPDGSKLLILAGTLRVFNTDDGTTEIPPPAPFTSAAGPNSLGTSPNDMVVSHDSKFVYVLSNASQRLTAVDLTQLRVAGTPVVLGSTPTSLSLSPQGRVFVSALNRIYEYDPATGAIAGELEINARAGRVVFSEAGTFGYVPNLTPVTGSSLLIIDPINRKLVNRVLTFLQGTIEEIIPMSESRIMVFSADSRAVYSINTNSLNAEQVAFPPVGIIPLLADITPTPHSPAPRQLFLVNNNTVFRAETAGLSINGQFGTPINAAMVHYAGPVFTGTVVRVAGYNEEQTLGTGGVLQPLIVRALDGTGMPVSGAPVAVQVPQGVEITSAMTTTNAQGFAQVMVRIAAGLGDVQVLLTVGAAPGIQKPFKIKTGGGGGAQPGSSGLQMISGNGQMVRENFPTPEPMVVRVLDPAGKPMVGATVEWKVAEGSGNSGGVTFNSDFMEFYQKTDARGQAYANYVGGRVINAAVMQDRVSAVANGLTVTFVHTTYLAALPTGGIAPEPLVQLVKPDVNAQIIGKAGTTLEDAVRIRVIVNAGAQLGQPLPNVGLRLVNPDNPDLPAAGNCTGVTVLTDQKGEASCNLEVGGMLGVNPLQIRIGGPQFTFRTTLVIEPGPPGKLTPTQGDRQTGNLGQTLPLALVAQVADTFGNLLPGAAVTWQVVTPGTATLLNTVSTADGTGKVSTRVQLGAIPGTVQVRVSAGTVSTIFNLTANANVSSLVKVSGDGQSTVVGAAFPSPLVIRAVDNAGSPVANLPVSFAVTTGVATLSSPTGTTNAQGQAQVSVTASAAMGPIVVTVGAAGLTVNFNLSAVAAFSQMVITGGDRQTAMAGQSFPAALEVQLTNAAGGPVQGIVVNFAVTSGLATLGSSTATTNAQGRAAVSARAGNTPGNVTVSATTGGLAVTFNLTVVPPGPQVTRDSFVIAAGGGPGVVPGALVAIRGKGVAPGIENCIFPNVLFGPPAAEFSNVKVTLDNKAAPIHSICNQKGNEEIVVQAPFDITASSVTAVITVQGGTTTVNNVPVIAFQPGIFETAGTDGKLHAVVIKSDNTFVSPSNPALKGETVKVVVTGLGAIDPASATAKLGAGEKVRANLVIGLNGEGVTVISATYATGKYGTYEVSFKVPENTTGVGPARPLSVGVMLQGGTIVWSNPSTMAIQ